VSVFGEGSVSVPPADLTAAVRQGARILAEAGVPSPQADAELLAAHVLGCGRGEVVAAMLRGDWLNPAQFGIFQDLLQRRAGRVPLQHLTGRAAFRRLVLTVGPGVFVPRAETEVLVERALAELARLTAPAGGRAGQTPLVVDLCTGSGAIALAISDEADAVRVVALEREEAAREWFGRNVSRLAPGERIELRAGDVRGSALAPDGVLADLAGLVDVVVANPPYIPPGAVPVEVEVAEHDPHAALYGGGEDGLEIPAAVIEAARSLLCPGGLLLMEHADVQGPGTRALAPDWANVRTMPDLTGRDRLLHARRPTPTPGDHANLSGGPTGLHDHRGCGDVGPGAGEGGVTSVEGMTRTPTVHSIRERSALEAYRALGPSPSDHSVLAVHCAAGHHVGGIYRAPGGLLYVGVPWAHGHGDRDRHDAAHHGGHRDTPWIDWLAVDAGPDAPHGAPPDDTIPAGCECGRRTLSRTLLAQAAQEGTRRMVID